MICQPRPIDRSIDGQEASQNPATPIGLLQRLADRWYVVLHWLCRHLYFEKIQVLNRERLSTQGPTLYVCLHRNGAVDGFVYRQLNEKGRFLISTQLRRSLFGRLIFNGIEVQRAKDGAGSRGSGNANAVNRCLEVLAGGGDVFVFPEGTSSLGPQHLPFQTGAAHLLTKFVERHSTQINVVPLGIFYHSPESFRSQVEVIVGESISTSFQEPVSHGQRVNQFQKRIETALEEVGINVPTAAGLLQIERTAKIISQDDQSCFPILKQLETGLSSRLEAASSSIDHLVHKNQLKCFQDVPLYPERGGLVSFGKLFLLSLLVLPGLVLNCLPLLAGWLAAKKFAKERNVVSLWKIIVGVPVFLITFPLALIATAFFGLAFSGIYLVFTALAWRFYPAWKRHGVECINGMLHPGARKAIANGFAEIRENFSRIGGNETRRLDTGSPSSGLLPHEIVFGLFLGLTWARLVVAVGFLHPIALAWFGGLALSCLVLWWAGRQPSNFRWRVRLFSYFFIMNASYAGLKSAVPLIETHYSDQWLMGIDSLFVGGNLSLKIAPWAAPFLTDLFSFCYLLFFPYLIFSMLFYGLKDLKIFKKICLGLFSIYGIGFIGYTLVPALGPYLFIPEFIAAPLEGGGLTRLNAEIVRVGSNRVDVFPSLHTAVSCFILFFDRKHTPWRFKLYLLPCIGLWISTIYLRYHYFIDLLAGFALAAVTFALLKKWELSRRPASSGTSRPIPIPVSVSEISPTAIELKDVATANLLPLPARYERGEGGGEGNSKQKRPSSPRLRGRSISQMHGPMHFGAAKARPSPPSAVVEGEKASRHFQPFLNSMAVEIRPHVVNHPVSSSKPRSLPFPQREI